MTQFGGIIAPGDGRAFSGRITFDQRISSVEAAASAPDDYILPGFIDLQVNGSHGIDVMTANGAELLALARHLAEEGTTAFLPTAITAPLERIEHAHSAIAEAIKAQAAASDESSAAAILGMHLEGPFISPRRLGAHPKLTLEPQGEPLERVLAIEHLRIATLAPEIAGAIEAIGRIRARGVVVSIGHTDATFAETQEAIAAGARMFTHLCNAMRPLHHRDPGVIAAAMLASDAFAAVIPDGVHVDPAMLKLVYRVRGASGMILTTDKVALAGLQTGEHLVGRARATVHEGVPRLQDGTIAGSVISMLDGVRTMIDRVGVSVGDVAMMSAANPASLMRLGDRGVLKIGARADLLILSREFKLKAVFIGGRELR
jgi:N-acetylglucosamine-6-phosphate deacetylase